MSVPSESTSVSEPGPVPHPSDPVEQLYAELEAKIREYRPKDDLAALQQAFRFASKYHEGQTRDSGEPYMAHPVMVAHILADMRMDVVAMETGLLHDVVEDTSVTVEQVRKEFGPEVARCVDGVTKLTKLDVFSAEDRQAESVRKFHRHIRYPLSVAFGFLIAQVQGPRPAFYRSIVGPAELEVGALQALEQGGVVYRDRRLPGQGIEEIQPFDAGLERRAVKYPEDSLDLALGDQGYAEVAGEVLSLDEGREVFVVAFAFEVGDHQ